MSTHARGILYHVAAGVVFSGLALAAMPDLATWSRPRSPKPFSTFPLLLDAFDKTRRSGNLLALRTFYAPGFEEVEIETAAGVRLIVPLLNFLQGLIDQDSAIEFESIGPPDAYGRIPVQSPPFELVQPDGAQKAMHRHDLLWSWDGSHWRIVRHRIEPSKE